MNIKSSPAPVTTKPSPLASLPPASPASEEPDKGSALRDFASLGAGAGGAVAGGIYGLAEGVVIGGVRNFPVHVKKGAELGDKIASPVGGILGAMATGVMVAVSAVATPLAAVIATGLGFVGATAVSTLEQTPAAIAETSKKGGEAGSQFGSKLGRRGESVGSVVGSVLGGVAGIGVALGRGVPDGVNFAQQTFREGVDMMAQLPRQAKQTWKTVYPAGQELAGASGAVLGGSAGLVTATTQTAMESVINSVNRGSQFARIASDFVAGK